MIPNEPELQATLTIETSSIVETPAFVENPSPTVEEFPPVAETLPPDESAFLFAIPIIEKTISTKESSTNVHESSSAWLYPFLRTSALVIILLVVFILSKSIKKDTTVSDK